MNKSIKGKRVKFFVNNSAFYGTVINEKSGVPIVCFDEGRDPVPIKLERLKVLN